MLKEYEDGKTENTIYEVLRNIFGIVKWTGIFGKRVFLNKRTLGCSDNFLKRTEREHQFLFGDTKSLLFDDFRIEHSVYYSVLLKDWTYY